MTAPLGALVAISLFLQAAPIAPEGLAAVQIFAAEPGTARKWLAATEQEQEGEASTLPRVVGKPLAGVDEADLIALHLAVAKIPIEQASALSNVFQHGHHGYLIRLSDVMSHALSRGIARPRLLTQVRQLAAVLRGEAKPAGLVQLSVADLQSIIQICRSADGKPVFVHFSE